MSLESYYTLMKTIGRYRYAVIDKTSEVRTPYLSNVKELYREDGSLNLVLKLSTNNLNGDTAFECFKFDGKLSTLERDYPELFL